MKKIFSKKMKNRLLALALAAVTIFSGFSDIPARAAESGTSELAPGGIETIADPETLQRMDQVYGTNTEHAGKIFVGKSVSDTGFANNQIDGVDVPSTAPDANNFLVTLSQYAQVMGLAEKLAVPIDAVFVLDTSGSMNSNSNGRYISMINAANEAINTLMSANDQNRVAVVAFSSSGYGGGTSESKAASILSDLKHYDGEAATKHLQRVNRNGEVSTNGEYVAGRNATTYTYTTTEGYGRDEYDVEHTVDVNAFRNAQNGGTNIQAGIALGGSILLDEQNTTALVNGKTMTRIPFIIVLSDGAPTFTSNAANWYDDATVLAGQEQGYGSDGDYLDAGNGFLPALTAAYYKGAITDHYYPDTASEENRCQIYTIGVGVGNSDEAKMTLNPKEELNRVANDWRSSFVNYYDKYIAGNTFNITVNRYEGGYASDKSKEYTISSATIAATKHYVLGNKADGTGMYAGGLGYNDAYFSVNNNNEFIETFRELVRLIQIKAISLPTEVNANADFSGYVHFYDPIGEYMEVKQMHGIVADGYFFRGATAAKTLMAYGNPADQNHDADFDAEFTEAINGRLTLSNSQKLSATDIKELVANAVTTGQLYWNSNEDFSNSFCWWGKSYTDSNGDEHMQYIDYAPGDSIEAIETAKSKAVGTEGAVPAGAEYVCRSYYYYGTATNQIEATADALLFAIRVQRSLTAPYQETVYVSIPGSLLNVERVLITADKTNPNNVTYESFVQAATPIRVIYEVGLRGDINAYNVADKLAGTAYESEKTVYTQNGSKNNKEGDVYYFYTNDWDRAASQAGHARSLAHAGFDVSDSNEFYTYTEDRMLYTKSENNIYAPVPASTALSAGTTYYYARDVYDWIGKTNEYTTPGRALYSNIAKRTEYIPISFSSDASIGAITINKDEYKHVKAGTHTSSSLIAENEIVEKQSNTTNTSSDVARPVKTDPTHADSHYTVFLGNNGRLALRADKAKKVSLTQVHENNTVITDADGKTVTVGDKLTYTIDVVNSEDAPAKIVVTDTVPAGTKLDAATITKGTDGILADSAVANTSTDTVTGEETTTITWTFNSVPAAGKTQVAFAVEVTEDALGTEVDSIDNQANIKIGNNPAYTTNKVTNPPSGKTVISPNTNVEAGIQIGQQLRYAIEYVNDTDSVATITIKDTVPAGTTLIDAVGDTYEKPNDGKNLTWIKQNVQPGASGVVEFYVVVDESAKTPIVNTATIQIGENGPTYNTNPVETTVNTGSFAISKKVAATIPNTDSSIKEFNLELTTRSAQHDRYSTLNGEYTIQTSLNGAAPVDGGKVVFVDGVANTVKKNGSDSAVAFTIKDGETITIEGLPAGLEIDVQEKSAVGSSESFAELGYTVTYKDDTGATTQKASVATTKVSKIEITNTYTPAAVSFALKGNKTLTVTSGELTNAVFDFGVWEWDSAQNQIKTVDPINTADVTISANDSMANGATKGFAFSAIRLSVPGTYEYLIQEITSSKMTGVTYDEDKYFVKVVVADGHAGQLVIESAQMRKNDGAYAPFDLNTELSFENTYKAKEVALNLSATKNLVGRELQANEFSYIVTDKNTGTTVAAEIATVIGTDKYTGTVNFAPINIYKEGTYTFVVSEINSQEPDINYASNTFEVVVVVDDQNGELVITSQTLNGTAVTAPTSNLHVGAFTNYYVPGSIEIALSATKAEEHRNLQNVKTANKALTGGEYSFVVDQVAADGTKIQEAVAVGQNGASVGTDNVAPIDFTKINFAIGQDKLQNPNYTGETLYYKIYEVVPTVSVDPYMNYDRHEWTVTVDVDYDRTTGVLTYSNVTYQSSEAGSASSATPAAFVNVKYPESITVVPEASKLTTGSLPGGEAINFSFAIRKVDMTAANNTGELVSVGTATASASATNFKFSELVFTEATPEGQPHKYWIFESNYDASNQPKNGITYDATRYLMEITVTKTNGLLSTNVVYKGAVSEKDGSTNPADYTETAAPAFKNEYAADTQITLTAKKVLTGDDLREGQFAFRLQRVDNTTNAPIGNAVNARNDGDGKITFGTLFFENSVLESGSADVILKYEMSEIDSKEPGITYDQTKRYVYVKLSHPSAGNLTATLCDAEGNDYTSGDVNNNTGVVFENSYAVVTGDHVDINATKTLSGRDFSAGEFVFELYLTGYKYDGETKVDITPQLVATTTNGANGQAKDAISFRRTYPATTRTGEYYYEIREVNNSKGGVTYDTSSKPVTVTITDSNAQLVAQVTYEGGNVPVFANSYKASAVTYAPVAKKELNGRDMKAKEFVFQIVQWNDATSAYDTVVATASNSTAGASSTVAFPNLYFTNVGTYKYEISEIQSTTGGISYDTTKYYLEVVVSDSGNGQLATSQKYYSDGADGQMSGEISEVIFKNQYTVTNGAVRLEANKVLIGRDMAAQEFDFEILSEDRSTVIATGENKLAANDGDSTPITFGTIAYTPSNYTSGTANANGGYDFTYWMKEVSGTKGGVTYDGTEYKVIVNVKDNGYGALLTSVTYYEKSGDNYVPMVGEIPAFENKYTVEPIAVNLEAHKSLLNKELKADEFKFELTEISNTSGTPSLSGTVNAFNDAEGKIIFKPEIKAAGTYTYNIAEVQNKQIDTISGSYVFDQSVYTAIIEVKDDGAGKLYLASKTYKLGNNDVAGPSFINTYEPKTLLTDLPAEFKVEKEVLSLNGTPLEISNFTGAFEFEIRDSQNTLLAIGTNGADGKAASFKDVDGNDVKFTYDRAAEYRYWITEKADDSKPHFTYDARRWEVRVNIRYNFTTGNLEFDPNNDVQVFSDSRAVGGATPKFTNVYNPKPATISISANKLLNGRPLKHDEFTFRVLENVGGLDIIRAESRNTTAVGQDNVMLTFNVDTAGEHTYIIDEAIPNVEETGITYDKNTRYTLKVNVAEDFVNGCLYIDANGNGQYDSGEELASYDTDNASNQIEFNNTYKGLPATATITVKKVLKGAALTDGAFTFELYDSQGTKIDTASNKADGTITFANLPKFANEGTYKYTIKEAAGSVADTTYDTSTIEVTVTVVDNLAGQMVATVNYPADITFENTYTPPTPKSDALYEIFTFSKVWVDGNDVLGKRPDTIYVEAYQDGVYVTDIVLSKENGWFNTAVLMKSQGGHVYEWTIKEKNVPAGYAATYDQLTRTVTNTYTGLLKEEAPKTGDNSLVGLFLALSGVSMAGLLALIFVKKRREERD